MLSNKQRIQQEALRLGFMSVGFAKADFLEEDAIRLESFLKNNYHGKMSYLENHFDLRVDPRKLVPNAKSVITLLLNYYPNESKDINSPKIAKYAWGMDYHDVIKEKLKALFAYINQHIGQIDGRGFVDSAPVLERTWANKSGLGWIGKNGNLINKQAGSFFFIATLICDLELEPDPTFKTDHCGTCTRCIDACPTDAIIDNKKIDASKCISYLTIELKDQLIPNAFEGKMDNWLFGCDVCQDVCPWNRFSKPHTEQAFKAHKEILNLSSQEWEALEESTFNTLFKHSPLKRSKWKGLQRNIQFINKTKDA
ncbi:MAG: tRNA epoxyqueuosine(34) reductase QueG [Chitinophagia bacterium]|nr:tRNA epoxyqueuosine(34) reductase QueG [Chitinophagia bacterium]